MRISLKASILALVALPLAAAAAGASTKTLIVCDDVADPATLDPHKQFAEKNHTLLQQIYEGLVRFDSDGKVEAALAESWERIDPLRVRFKLRKNVKFHDGEAFKANSVKFSFDRYLNPATGFPGIPFLSSIARVEVIDDYTVDIVTSFPDGILLNRLAGFTVIVPEGYIKANGEDVLLTKPVGTGAFKFDHWKKGKEIVLSANPEYWMAGFPKVERLIFRFLPAGDQIPALFAGNIHLMSELPGTMTLRIAENPKTKVIKKYTYNTVVTSLNTSEGPLKDVRVRQAINYAINKDEMIQYDLLANGRAIATVTMAGEEGHNPQLKPYPFDRKKAKALLDEAGIPHQSITLNALVKEQGRRTIGIIKEHLRIIGITVNVHYTNDANIIKDIASKKWDMVVGNCSDPMVHSFFIQSIVFYSKSPYALLRDSVYDAKLEAMMMELDPVKRPELGRELDSYIYNQALGLFTYQRLRTYASDRRVHYQPYVSGMPYYFSTFFGEATGPSERK